jgi:hypothetical protein
VAHAPGQIVGLADVDAEEDTVAVGEGEPVHAGASRHARECGLVRHVEGDLSAGEPLESDARLDGLAGRGHRRHRPLAQHKTSADPRLDDSLTSVRQRRCDHRLRTQTIWRSAAPSARVPRASGPVGRRLPRGRRDFAIRPREALQRVHLLRREGRRLELSRTLRCVRRGPGSRGGGRERGGGLSSCPLTRGTSDHDRFSVMHRLRHAAIGARRSASSPPQRTQNALMVG